MNDACPGARRTSARGSATAVRFIRGPLALALLCIAVLSGCGGDDNGGTSPASLKNDLIPPSQFPDFTKVARSFEWDDPIDFAVEGLSLPEATPPSDAVKAMEDASFGAAVGEHLLTGKGGAGPNGQVLVAQFGSDGEAVDALDYVRKEALKQPCFAACSVEAKEFAVAGIPGAKGVQQMPLAKPPPDAPPPFSSYGIGFTIGPQFFLAVTGGAPGEVKKSQVLDAAKALYDRNTKTDAAS
jgi:hypothetical protein